MEFNCKKEGIKCEGCRYYLDCLNNGLLEYLFLKRVKGK